MRKPTISIVSPTYNSEKTLSKTLRSIKRQNYPKEKIEVLIIDGGSSDETVKIAKKFGCKVINNPKTDIVNAQYLGYLAARGRYLLYLAPDEVLENADSLRIKTSVFNNHSKIKSVLPTGYKTPQDYSPINYYINEFGDPFSLFMYRESKSNTFLIRDLEKSYKKIMENKDCIVFSFSNEKKLPLIELWAGGCVLDLQYVKKNFPQIKQKPELIPLLFYLLNRKGNLMGVTKNDPTVHYSTGSVRKYLKKIRSRVEFNIFQTPMGKGGFSGRSSFENPLVNYKKFLFIPYSFSLLLPLIDSIYLTATRRQSIYLLHLPLCFYTSLLIIYYHFIKWFKIGHVVKLYGH